MATKNGALRHSLALAALFVVGTGCGARSGMSPGDLRRSEYPAWVTQGSGCQTQDGIRSFLGVGAVAGIRNMALARTTSDNRARAEAAKVFELYVTGLVKGYVETANAQATGSDGLQDASLVAIDDAHIEQAIKAMMAVSLNGIQVVEHWLHPVDGGVYALARLDLHTFIEDLNRIKELPEPIRDFARRNAEALHSQCAHESAVAPPPAAAAPTPAIPPAVAK